MANSGEGEAFFDDLLEEQENVTHPEDELGHDSDGHLSDDHSLFSTSSLNSKEVTDIYGSIMDRPSTSGVEEPVFACLENRSEIDGLASEGMTTNAPSVGPYNDSDSIPRGRSIAHDIILNNHSVFMSFHIETGGEYCGIVQISAELCRFELGAEGGGASITKDIAKNIKRCPLVFNKYIKPDSNCVWSEACTAIHGLGPNDDRISSADPMRIVWHQFENWVDANVKRDEKIILVAYNGQRCDLRWLWKLTQAPHSPYNMPPKIEFFLDPCRIMGKFKSCHLNKSKSKLDSYELGVVWKHIHSGTNLNGAHDSLIDTKAQTDILIHQHFVPFINQSFSVQTIDDIFSKTQQNEWRKEMEPAREVHNPWQELTAENNIKWSPSSADSYYGAEGGPIAGPSAAIQAAAKRAESLACLFLFIVPLTFFAKVATFTNNYMYEHWVVVKEAFTVDGVKKKRSIYKDVPALTNRRATPGRRHRGDTERVKFKATQGFVLCWVGILILQGAHFGADKRSSRMLWRNPPHGISIPYVRNSMSRDAYEFMRRSIKFCDNTKRKERNVAGYDPLFKVRYPLEVMMKGMRGAWIAGQHVTIDESMIKYMGRAVTFIQYMPAKPIKHGIKGTIPCVQCYLVIFIIIIILTLITSFQYLPFVVQCLLYC